MCLCGANHLPRPPAVLFSTHVSNRGGREVVCSNVAQEPSWPEVRVRGRCVIARSQPMGKFVIIINQSSYFLGRRGGSPSGFQSLPARLFVITYVLRRDFRIFIYFSVFISFIQTTKSGIAWTLLKCRDAVVVGVQYPRGCNFRQDWLSTSSREEEEEEDGTARKE